MIAEKTAIGASHQANGRPGVCIRRLTVRAPDGLAIIGGRARSSRARKPE
jgi:hypothetical protein